MQLVPDGTFRKVRNNIDRLFDKNLTDLIRGIRNNKENEARYIASCIEEIKAELRQDSIFVKANAIEKLAYLQMLGYDISWASFNIIEVMASTRYSEKRIGYLAAAQAFNDETDVLMLTTNLIRKDLQSSNIYDVGVALSGLSCFATSDLSRDLVNDVVNLLSSSRPYVRKKAILLLYKIFLKYPESLRPTFPRLKERLEDQDPGVQSAAVNVVCELARKNPRNYLSLQNVFFKLLNSSSNNWMLIKIIKLFGSLVPHEPKLGRKLLEPLTNLINSTSAMSLLYECINTVIAILISISSEGPGDYTPSIQLCVQKLGVLIDDSDQNLKYLGLLAMGRILLTHPKAVQAHKDIVLRCLDDKDESIRLRALDLLYGMMSKKNIMEIVRKLMEHVDAAEGSFYRDELLQRIISICSHDNYKYIANFEWYISVLVELTKVEGTKHGVLIAEQIQDVSVRVQSIRHFAVSQMALLVQNAQLLLQGNGTQRNNVAEVLLAAAWICGEFAQHVNGIVTVLDAILRIKLSVVPGALLSVFVQNIAKLYTFELCRLEKEDDWDGIESLDNLLSSKLPEFQYTDHLEAQERSCNLMAIVKFVIDKHVHHVKVGEVLSKHFEGELNPVATKAQKKVPVPEGLNLDEYINEGIESWHDEEDNEDEDESEDEFAQTPSQAKTSPYGAENLPQYGRRKSSSEVQNNREKSPSSYNQQQFTSNGISYEAKNKGEEILKKRKSRQEEEHPTPEESLARRRYEQENNPYYVKERPSRMPMMPSSAEVMLANQQPKQLQSPLEIAGVVGLQQYMQQRGATLSWKEAAKQKKTKKEEKRTKRTRRTKKEEEEEQIGEEDREEEHFVYRGDGEMPEGALSSSAEEEQLNDEFRALDVDLEEPLREAELAKQRLHRLVKEQNSSDGVEKRKKTKKIKRKKKKEEEEEAKDRGEGSEAQDITQKKKKAKKSRRKSDRSLGDDSGEGADQKQQKVRKKRLTRDDYTSIDSPVPIGTAEVSTVAEEPLISLMDLDGNEAMDPVLTTATTKTEESNQ